MTTEGDLSIDPERLSHLSERELNAEFRREFYDAPPLWILYDIGDPEKARQLEVLTANLRWFLAFAVNQKTITLSCSRRAERIVRLHYIAGTMQKQFPLLFDFAVPESGGLFDPERGKELDRLLYMELMREYFGTGRLMDIVDEGSHRRFRDAVRLAGLPDDEELLRNWRNEFFEKYHEEP